MASDGKGSRLVFHFAGSCDRLIVPEDEWAYENAVKKDIAKWQVFWYDDGIKHIVNMDNVTFIEVVDDE